MDILSALDWVVISVYFGGIMSLAVWMSLRRKSTRADAAEYFLAGRHVGWFVIGASLFASNIGSEHLIGLAGAGASSGTVMGQYEVQAAMILLLLGWVFVPFYLRTGVFTMPEFLERRYGPAARWYLAVVSVISYVLTKVAVTVFAGALVFETLMGIDFWVGALIVVVATGIYTILGGLRVVLYTDLVQMFVVVGGAVAVTIIGLVQLGGWGRMVEITGPRMMSMWRPLSDPDFPWTGVLFGAPIVGMWYWCTDQFIVQRVLAARNIDQARRATYFAGMLKILPVFVFVVPGMVAYSLAQEGRLDLPNADAALPTLIATLLPVGVRGLVVAGFLAALMSSLSSVFNSCSTLMTVDIYQKIDPKASQHRLVVVGQISTAVLVVLGLAWIPLMSRVSSELYTYLQSVQAYIAPPITAVFLLGVFWRRVNAHGAIAALLLGFVLGMSRLGLEVLRDRLDPGGALYYFATINFMHMAILLFAISVGVLVVVSLLTPAQSDEKLKDLTYATTHIPESDRKTPGWRLNVLLSLFVVAAVVATWIYFSPWVHGG